MAIKKYHSELERKDAAKQYRATMRAKVGEDEWKRQRQDAALRCYYGISLVRYEELLLLQDHVCAICGQPETVKSHRFNKMRRLAVDHHHITKKIRGLLCTGCNTMLGSAKDSEDVLMKAISYLRTHRG